MFALGGVLDRHMIYLESGWRFSPRLLLTSDSLEVTAVDRVVFPVFRSRSNRPPATLSSSDANGPAMRWSDPGAQAILNLRTLHRNGEFEQYWEDRASTLA
jgi:hypothetical protein